MSTMTRKMKRGDTLPELICGLKQRVKATVDGVEKWVWRPIDLGGATVKLFLRQRRSSERTIGKTVEILSALLGRIRYAWADGDTGVKGKYYIEFEITFFDGRKMTVPNRGNIRFDILDDLGD